MGGEERSQEVCHTWRKEGREKREGGERKEGIENEVKRRERIKRGGRIRREERERNKFVGGGRKGGRRIGDEVM